MLLCSVLPCTNTDTTCLSGYQMAGRKSLVLCAIMRRFTVCEHRHKVSFQTQIPGSRKNRVGCMCLHIPLTMTVTQLEYNIGLVLCVTMHRVTLHEHGLEVQIRIPNRGKYWLAILRIDPTGKTASLN